MVLEAAATAATGAAVGGAGLFEYNRKNFLYDRKLRQDTEYQILDFRIKQAELWREDVKDITGLTTVKMDTYNLICAVMLGFCVVAFCEGRLHPGTPPWIVGCHTLSLGGAFIYFTMGLWLSMQASITAKAYEVRLLTQIVRLPVPSWTQLEGARTYGSAFEKADARQMFRVPFVMGTQERVCDYTKTRESKKKARENAEQGAEYDAPTGMRNRSKKSADVWGLEGRGDDIYELDGTLRSDPRMLRHMSVIREAQKYWLAHDGLARVALSLGTNQLVTALSYYVIGYVLVSNHAVIASWLVVMLLMVLMAALVRLDMSLTARDYRVSVMLMSTGPCVVAVAASQWAAKTPTTDTVAALLSPIPFAFHSMWMFWLLKILAPKEANGAVLPTGFKAVMFTDIFGWIKKLKDHEGIETEDFQPSPVPGPLDDSTAQFPGSGPAVQAARYQDGQPIPTRPEDLPGAAESPFHLEGLRKEDFEPTTFVPREKGYDESAESTVTEQQQANLHPGYVPWRVFCAATVLLVNLWWISGVLALLAACNMNPLMIDPHGHGEEGHGGEESLLQFGEMTPPRRYQDGQLVRPQLLRGGEPVLTQWPTSRIQAHGLACGGSGEHPALVASTRFGLYAAWLGRTKADESGPGLRHASFEVLPCGSIRGEAVQDLALGCGDAGVGCRAFVLHGQGEQLSACAVGSFLGNSSWQHPLQMQTTTRLTDEWLEEARADGLSQEEITSIAHVRPCRGGGGGHCAFVQTNRGRIVEVRMDLGADTKDAEADWYPTHVLQASVSAASALGGGALHHVGGGYLGVLNAHGQLEVLNPQDGALIGLWQLPVDQTWKSMCSNGNDLFFLADGRQPELWRFPVPGRVRPINELWVPSFESPEQEEAEALESLSPRYYFLGYRKRHVNVAAAEEV